MSSDSSPANVSSFKKACRLCDQFRQKLRNMSKPENDSSTEKLKQETKTDCPLELHELGQNTWSFLHTMAAYYPEKPTPVQQSDMLSFIDLFANFFPCEDCATHLKTDIKQNPPNTSSQENFALWMCQTHNRVNVRLGKPEFDCSRVKERWKDGWNDGSCD